MLGSVEGGEMSGRPPSPLVSSPGVMEATPTYTPSVFAEKLPGNAPCALAQEVTEAAKSPLKNGEIAEDPRAGEYTDNYLRFLSFEQLEEIDKRSLWYMKRIQHLERYISRRRELLSTLGGQIQAYENYIAERKEFIGSRINEYRGVLGDDDCDLLLDRLNRATAESQLSEWVMVFNTPSLFADANPTPGGSGASEENSLASDSAQPLAEKFWFHVQSLRGLTWEEGSLIPPSFPQQEGAGGEEEDAVAPSDDPSTSLSEMTDETFRHLDCM